MSGFKIGDLNTEAQKIIREKNIDKNRDNLINDDNGELATLLSATGKKDIHELAEKDNSVAYLLFGEVVSGAGFGFLGNKFLDDSRRHVSQEEIKESAARILKENQNDVKAYKAFGRYGKYVVGHVPQEKTAAQATSEAIKNIQNTLKGSRRAGNLLMGVTFGFAVLTVITALNAHIGKKPIHYVKDENNVTPKPQETAQPTELENTYRNAFKGLGVSEDTELNEYTPQKGEYWISILKAKYGVDDVTAQKMANKIKEMIYDDPKASKQTPIMYLPQTWTFEGKTYQYNDNAQADKTENYSDDVKTEMGKMGKDLKYNK